jgi:hypothetical protein
MSGQCKVIKKGFFEPNIKVVIDGKEYHSSFSISANYKLKRSALYTSKQLSRLFNRFEEMYDKITIKGISYYHIDLEDRGWV